MKRFVIIAALWTAVIAALTAGATPTATAGVINATNYTSAARPFDPTTTNRIVDDLDKKARPHPNWGAVFSGAAWQSACSPSRASLDCGAGYLNNYLSIDPADQTGLEWATWIPKINRGGRYEVWVSFVSDPANTTDARYIVYHHEGQQEVRVNQTRGDSTPGNQLTWCKLGTYPFKEGTEGYVKETNTGGAKVKIADAVGFKLVKALGPYKMSGYIGDEWQGSNHPMDNVVVRSYNLAIVPYKTTGSGTYTLLLPYGFSGSFYLKKEYYLFKPTSGGSTSVSDVRNDFTVNWVGHWTRDDIPPPWVH